MRRNMKTGIKLFLRNFFDRFSKTSYRQDLQAILKFLKVTGCYYCCCYYAVLCDLNRKIVQFFWFKRKLQRYVPLNRVIPNFVAFIVVLLRWYCLVFLFFFSPFFRRNVRFPPKKNFSLGTPGAIVFHIRSYYGIWADNRDLVNQSER